MNVKLYQASCFDTLARVQEAGGADLVFTSPPYCDARTYGNGVSWGMEEYSRLGDAIFGALKPGGHCLFNVDAPVREWRDGMGTERGFHPWKIMLDWAERVGFRVPDRLAFGRLGSPGAYTGRFRNDWEPLLWFQRPGAVGFFDKHAIAEDGSYKPPTAGVRKHDGSMRNRQSSGWAIENGKIHRGTFWGYGSVGAGKGTLDVLYAMKHPASFPYALAADVVKCFAPVGGLVVDPFLGSGTTAHAALHHGCSFIGGDLYTHEDGTPWVSKVKETLSAAFDPGALALFGSASAPVVSVHLLAQSDTGAGGPHSPANG